MSMRRALVLSWMLSAACARNEAPPPKAPVPEAPKPLVCDGLATCEASCDAGDADSCVKAAKAMHDAPLEADALRLRAVLSRACDAGKAASCAELSKLLLYSPALAIDEAASKAALTKGCDLGSAVSCLGLATDRSAATDEEVRKSATGPLAQRAAKLAREGCDKGEGRSCLLASMIGGMIDAPDADDAKLEAKALELLQQSCLGGAVDDCMPAAYQLAKDQGGTEALFRAKNMLRRGCDLGALDACMQLGAEMPRHLKEPIYRKACAAGSPEGCIVLGKAEKDGVAAASDDTKGAKLMTLGVRLARARCDLAEDEACRVLARSLPLGVLTAPAAEETAQYLTRVCERPSAVLCSDLADAMGETPGLDDPKRHRALKRLACDNGYPFACPDPIAKLGVYVPFDAPIVDRRSGLAWASSPGKASSFAAAASQCPKDTKLPTKKQLETLAEPAGGPRPFIKATTPPGAKLWSADPAGGAGAPWVFDPATGTIAEDAGAPAIARCVRVIPKSAKPKGPTLSLRMDGPHLEHTVRDAKGKVLSAITIANPSDALSLGQLWDPKKASGPVAIEVAANVEWAMVARFLRDAKQQGLELGAVWLAP
jgi:TPR repeat protein